MIDSDQVIHYHDFAYEPEVVVRPVFEVTCDGGCGWDATASTADSAEGVAQAHRDWHRKIVAIMEGVDDDGVCSICSYDRGPVLIRPRHGSGRPWLVCPSCEEGWDGVPRKEPDSGQ